MSQIDPHRTLGVAPGATQAEIKRAYRRLAKQYHPDSGGERALPRFLAIQAAYEALVEPGTVGRAPTPRSQRTTAPAWQADPARARATRDAYRTRRRGPAGGPAGEPAGGPAAGPKPSGSPGAAHDDPPAGQPSGRPPGASRSRRRPKATIGSTSYDGADREPFDPAWDGATWYGAGSGTYWTINPKEYADPRKHGPEYLARSLRAAPKRRGARPTEEASPASAPGPDEAGPRPDGEPARPASGAADPGSAAAEARSSSAARDGAHIGAAPSGTEGIGAAPAPARPSQTVPRGQRARDGATAGGVVVGGILGLPVAMALGGLVAAEPGGGIAWPLVIAAALVGGLVGRRRAVGRGR